MREAEGETERRLGGTEREMREIEEMRETEGEMRNRENVRD